MKRSLLCRGLEKLAFAACVLVCVLCAFSALQSWAGARGEKALLFAAGIQAESAPENEGGVKEKQISSPRSVSDPEKIETRENTAGPDDGVVPFHSDELPGASATPDPARASAPVEEILIDGGAQVDNFFVRDTSDSGTDLEAELQKDPTVHIKGDGSVEVLIYHTHTSEAYSKEYTGFYYTDMETRTGNRDMSVVAAGEALKKELEARGIGVVHDMTVNDELFNGSYSRSWEVIQKNLKEHPGIQVTIDLHRDSMTTESGVKYKPTALIGGRKAAQVMFLAGSNANDDWDDFPNWEENLRLILRVQQKGTELYPNLMRPLDFSDCKYNMNATSGSMLVEVGTEVSTVSEARYSGKLLGEILGEALLETKQ